MGRNNYFKFKQFTITQEKSAMKVGIDGVLLGAWALAENPSAILDVGAGTGLIALMMAQRFPTASVDAVEVDASACEDARFNFGQSLWNERLWLFQTSFQQFAEESVTKYDLVVSNPPFFENSVNVKTVSRELARNSENLGLDELCSGAGKILSEDGVFAVVFPFQRFDELVQVASKNGLFLKRFIKIRPNPEKPFHRILAEFSKNEGIISVKELVIESMKHDDYTDDYRVLTRDFYLKF